jgi:hypothetical protein
MTLFPARATLMLVLAAVVVTAPPTMVAQDMRSGRMGRAGLTNPVRAPAPLRNDRPGMSRRAQSTHWLRGGIIGGLILGAGMSTLIAGLNNASDRSEVSTGGRAGLFLGFGAIGFGIGALIGGQFRK